MGSEAQPSAGRPVRDLVREVVVGLAPDELPLLEGLLELDDATAVRRVQAHGQRRDPLGFGVGEAAVLVTPVIWVALDQAARRYGEMAADGVWRRSSEALGRLFRRNGPSATVPPLTREQLGEVRSMVLETAGQRGLSARRAEDLANAVVTGLLLSEPSEPAGPSDPGAGGPDSPAIGAPAAD
ncbi:hypothetical protein [Streptomyces sp. NPDC004266]|uniref:hypothetical protein n=1 Tax=Streptomyces sp. NPDC004266 TaxID=3364693 RepID=UPI0036999A31